VKDENEDVNDGNEDVNDGANVKDPTWKWRTR
jgi:hypothetical protein